MVEIAGPLIFYLNELIIFVVLLVRIIEYMPMITVNIKKNHLRLRLNFGNPKKKEGKINKKEGQHPKMQCFFHAYSGFHKIQF